MFSSIYTLPPWSLEAETQMKTGVVKVRSGHAPRSPSWGNVGSRTHTCKGGGLSENQHNVIDDINTYMKKHLNKLCIFKKLSNVYKNNILLPLHCDSWLQDLVVCAAKHLEYLLWRVYNSRPFIHSLILVYWHLKITFSHFTAHYWHCVEFINSTVVLFMRRCPAV